MSGSCWLMQAICRLLDAQPQLLLASLKRNWPPVGSTYTCEKGNWIYLGRMWSHLPPPKKHRKVIGIQISTARQSYSFPVFLGPPIGVYPGLELSTCWINLGLEAKMTSNLGQLGPVFGGGRGLGSREKGEVCLGMRFFRI